MPGDATKILQPLQLESSFDLLALHRLNPGRYPHLLQTVSRAADAVAYDILFAFPEATLRLDSAGIRFIANSYVTPDLRKSATFLDSFDRWWESEQKDIEPACRDLPFSGGWFLYLGYELCAEIESTLKTRIPKPINIPTALATRFKTAIIYDHRQRTFYYITEPDCRDRLELIKHDIKSAASMNPMAASSALQPVIAQMQQEPPQRYLDGV